jgi:imidazolonepropionase-like amidohydrolase
LDRDLMALAATRGIAVVPTMLQRARFAALADRGQRYPIWQAQMRAIHETRERQAVELFAAGVTLLLGTDQGTEIPHGSAPAEAAAMVRAGIPSEAVIKASTWGARAFLGVPALAEGASADLVVYEADPRNDIGQLTRPLAVVLRGRIQAGPAGRG